MESLLDQTGPNCDVCGNGLRARARFCDVCGTAVTPAATVSENKQITVLFADVVGSMSLAASLEPERLREIMYQLFNRSARVVQRYHGTVDKFTGDGLMALFGAPVALEDHAVRACIAALEIQSVARGMANELRERDGIDLQIRVGLNSGFAIAGTIGTRPDTYTAVGHPVGMAQRMESAADPGTVLCSESTARLAERVAIFGPAQRIWVKGTPEPVTVRGLDGIDKDRAVLGRDDGPLIGRDVDLATLVDAFRSTEFRVIGVVGDPGLGKSRLVRELIKVAGESGTRIQIVRCDSHIGDIPLHALGRTLEAMFGTRGLDAVDARERVIAQLQKLSGMQAGDSQIIFELLSIDHASAPLPKMSPDARRARVVEVMARLADATTMRSLLVIEDIHWIDDASEEVLKSFAASLDPTKSTLVTTSRPGHHGPLQELTPRRIDLRPIDAAATRALAAALIGQHETTAGLVDTIAADSGGNPFFVEEIVHDLAGRGLLAGCRGDYRLVAELTEHTVPSSVQAVIAARIDRLPAPEKSILHAASVVGADFDVEVLRTLAPGVEARLLDNLVSTDLIDQIAFLPLPRYRFRHPLVRSVCYESQLRSVRAASHLRLAESLQHRDAASLDISAALIAQHFEAAGELSEAYGWFMRSADWMYHRDVSAARKSWQMARDVADRLPKGSSNYNDKRIAPRARLSFSAWLVGGDIDEEQLLAELRTLTRESDNKLPLALAMTGRLHSLLINQGKPREAVALATEMEQLYDKVDGSPSDRAEILSAAALTQYMTYRFEETLQTIDRLRTFESQLTGFDFVPVLAMSGVIKTLCGRDGQADLARARELGFDSDPVTYAGAVAYSVDLAVLGFTLVDADLLQETSQALRRAEEHGSASGHAAYGLSLARWAHGTALLNGATTDHDEGLQLLELSRSSSVDPAVGPIEAQITAQRRQRGQLDDQLIDALEASVFSQLHAGDFTFVGYAATELIRSLIGRATPSSMRRAEEVVRRLEEELNGVSQPAFELWPLLCRSLFARATGDKKRFETALGRYQSLAHRLGAKGHLATAADLTLTSAKA
jgi:adenylate cyclase